MKQWQSKFDLSDRVSLTIEIEQQEDCDYGMITTIVFEGGITKYQVNWTNAARSYHYEYELSLANVIVERPEEFEPGTQ